MVEKNEKKQPTSTGFALGRENYILLIIGLIVVIIGFALMAGGKSSSPNEFSKDIFSFRRITLAPVMVLFGFLFEIYAIMHKPRK
jgi:uncharacterized BrkB/YihY/UPF0761 family membrane protein